MTVGVIIANTGSPASPDPDAVEAYLREYLMDDRIRQLPRPLWRWLLCRRILPKRKYASSKRYRFIWTPEGSPLIAIQQRLVDAVQRTFDADRRSGAGDEPVLVRSAMSYGEPSIGGALEALRDAGADSVVLLPLYPQSAYSPTMAVVDSFGRALEALAWHPRVRIVDNYHDDPTYIEAMADAIGRAGFDPAAGDRLVLSLHAIPLKDERAGDTYRGQVAESARLLAGRLGIDPSDITVSYQSVFGPNKNAWTQPLTLDVLAGWRDEAFRVVCCCPGFAIDCLETLYDVPNDMVVALEGDGAMPVVDCVEGGVQSAINTCGRFVWVPSLNDSEAHVRVVRSVLDGVLRS